MRKPTCFSMIVAAVLLSIVALTPVVHGATDTIMVGNFFFGPNIDTVFKGDTVVWVFTGVVHTTSHNVAPLDRIWDSGIVSAGGSFTFVFDTVGTFPYRCDVHPTLMLATMVVLLGSTGIENAEGIRPTSSTLDDNYPNPFNPSTAISYTLPEPASVTLTIYDALGRHVSTLVQSTQPAGAHSITWNGTDDQGQAVGSGVYFYRLSVGGETTARKMLLLK